MAGLQGSGKSTLAPALAARLPAVLLSVDPIESALHRAGVPASFERGLAAYLVAEEAARANLALGWHVVVDAANYVSPARRMWSDLAAVTEVALVFVETVCDQATLAARLGTRQRNLPGFAEVTAADAAVRAAESDPWGDEPRITVDTSASVDIAALVARLTTASR